MFVMSVASVMSAFSFRVVHLCCLFSYCAQFCPHIHLNFTPFFFPPQFLFEVSCKPTVAFFLNRYSVLVDPITLRLLSKHAEKPLWHFSIFIFNIPHQADSLTPQN